MTFYVDPEGEVVEFWCIRRNLDNVGDDLTPGNDETPAHRGEVHRDPAGWFKATCLCGWRDITWTSRAAAHTHLDRHIYQNEGPE